MGWQQLPISSRARADRRCITVLIGWHLLPISSRARADRRCMHQCADGLTDAADRQPRSSRSGWHQANALELRWGVEVRILTTRGRRSSSVVLADRPAHRLADKRPRQSIGQPIADKRPRKSIGQPIGSFLPI